MHLGYPDEGESADENSNAGSFNSVLKDDRIGPTKANTLLLEWFINLRKCAVLPSYGFGTETAVGRSKLSC